MTFQFSRTISGLLFVCFFCLALTLLSGCGGGNNGVVDSAFAQSGGATATRWEYRVVEMEGTIAERERELNQLGLEGWELQSILGASQGRIMSFNHYFKRPKR